MKNSLNETGEIYQVYTLYTIKINRLTLSFPYEAQTYTYMK